MSYYISTRWEVVKELSYLAVSRELLDFLFEFAIVGRDLNSLSSRHSIVGTSNIPVLCERLLQRSVDLDLVTALDEHIFSVRMDPIIGMLYCSSWAKEISEAHRVDARDISDIVDDVYRRVKIGRREPTDSFIRVSNVQVQWPLPTVSKYGAMIIAYDLETPDLCMFFTCNVKDHIGKSEMGHDFARCISNRHTVSRVQLDGRDPQMWREKIDRVFEMAEREALPLRDINHDHEVCPRCKIMDVVL